MNYKININEEKIKTFKEITEQMLQTYIKKNKDYGNSFTESWQEYGPLSLAIRLGDKYRRYKNLIENEAAVKNETIEDTLLDMANYCILGLIELKKERWG